MNVVWNSVVLLYVYYYYMLRMNAQRVNDLLLGTAPPEGERGLIYCGLALSGHVPKAVILPR